MLLIIVTSKKKIAGTFQLDHMTIQNKIINLCCDIFIKARLVDHFWALVSNDKYPNLKKCVGQLRSCFGSTYLCEAALSN